MRWPKVDLNKILLRAEMEAITIATKSRGEARRLYWALYGRNRTVQANVIIHTPIDSQLHLSPRESLTSEATNANIVPNSRVDTNS